MAGKITLGIGRIVCGTINIVTTPYAYGYYGSGGSSGSGNYGYNIYEYEGVQTPSYDYPY